MTQQDYLWKVDRAKKLSFEYYVLNRPSVSDEVFDGLVAQIEQAEQEHPEWVVADSPTQQVGSDLNGNGRHTIRHRTPMLSCQKAQTDNKSTNREKLEKWLNATEKAVGHKNFNYCIEWKFDGISCSLVYLNGDLISAATRGDHFKGQDITEHVMQMLSVPHVLKRGTTYHDRVEVRGEIVVFKSTLPLLTDQDGKMYKDCRSAAAGLTNQAIVDSQCSCLKFMPWELDAPLFSCNNSHSESLKLADFHNFTYGMEAQVVPASKREQLFDMIEKMESCRDNQPFPVDGLVIKVDDKQLFASLGATFHHPHGSIAYKFAPAKTITRCTRIEVTVGKTGKRTPVVHFEPVTIMGRTVRKASVGSEATLQRLGVVMGSTIEVGLANDVRPTVYRVIEDAENLAPEVTENDPLEGIDFPGEESPVCSNIVAASEEEKPEEPWLAPSFADLYPETQVLHEAPTPPVVEPAAVPVSEDDGQQSPGGSVAAPNGKHKILAAVTTLCVALAIVCGAAVLLGALAFALPVLNGSLRA